MTLKVLITVFIIILSYSQAEKYEDKDEDRAILGGTDAKPGQFPYVVFILIEGTTPYDRYLGYACTGSIVSPKWVITAYHCFESYIKRRMKLEDLEVEVLAGSVDRGVSVWHEQKRKGNQTVLLEKHWNILLPRAYNWDVAIIQVVKEFVFNLYVKPIRIAKAPYIYDRVRTFTVVGFGHTERPPLGDFDILNNTKLHYTSMTMRADKEDCAKLGRISAYYPSDHWDGSQLCLHPIRWSSAPCNGDSGGPLIYNGLLFGVSSGRINIKAEGTFAYCGREGNYHVYAYVSMHEKWLRENIEGLPEFLPLTDNETKARHVGPRSSLANVNKMTNRLCVTAYLILQSWIAYSAF